MSHKEKLSSITEILSGKKESEITGSLLSYCIQQKFSIALWRKPNQSIRNLIIDFESGRDFEIEELEELSEGFLFAPFDSGKQLFIKAQLRLSISEKINLDTISLSETQVHHIEDALQNMAKPYLPSGGMADQSTLEHEYVSFVESSIHEIKNGVFKKVVPARRLIKEWTGNPVEMFLALCQRYTNAFVSIVYTPESGFWVGATPELLLSVSRDNIFNTSALAGTQKFEDNVPLHAYGWTQKEIEEQAMVSRYIINCFKTIRLREFEEDGPKTVKAGNLVHLRTDFSVDMTATNFPNLGSTMLRLLHPTSAVCGMPKEPAIQFLKTHENFEREYFSGYLGPVNFDKETSIYVNIRCAKLYNEYAIIFSGAGVTAFSSPEAEWTETELKARTLLNTME